MNLLWLWIRSALWSFLVIWGVVMGAQGINAALSGDETLEGLILRDVAIEVTGLVAWAGFWVPQAYPVQSLFLFFTFTIYRVLLQSQKTDEKILVENVRKSARVKPPVPRKTRRRKGR
jgi:hypothetical protein